MLRMSDMCPTTSNTNEIWEEDLSWLATRGVELGRTLCTCSAFYHVLRGPLRASGFIGDLKKGQQILASTILPLINKDTRVLIAGSADTSIFSTVGRISHKHAPEITVVDRCRAPLALIEEFAVMRDLFCRTLHSDISDLDGHEKWDLILLHYTSMFFDRLNRQRCFERLSRSLVRGGVLVCMDRMMGPPASGNSKERELACFQAAREALRGSEFESSWRGTELDLYDVLRHYFHEIVTREDNYPTVAEIEGLLTSIGFKILSKGNTRVEATIKERT